MYVLSQCNYLWKYEIITRHVSAGGVVGGGGVGVVLVVMQGESSHPEM